MVGITVGRARRLRDDSEDLSLQTQSAYICRSESLAGARAWPVIMIRLRASMMHALTVQAGSDSTCDQGLRGLEHRSETSSLMSCQIPDSSCHVPASDDCLPSYAAELPHREAPRSTGTAQDLAQSIGTQPRASESMVIGWTSGGRRPNH
eukprot:1044856-Rhodomonas_salina.3